MSIALELSSITPEVKAQITKTCMIKPNASQYNDDPQHVMCFATNTKENAVYIPLGAWRNFLDDFPDHEYPKTKVEFKKKLYTLDTDPKKTRDQDVVASQALAKLETDHTVFLACFPGYGKTTVGNYFTAHFKLKTAVLCHIDKVNDQWKAEYEKNSTAKVQRVEGSAALDPDADVYIFGVQKAATMPREALAHIGLVIFDEAHIATVTAFTKSLLRFQPKYVIGLSATPKRPDGMHKMLVMYFGPKKEFIVREEVKDFTVYKVETPHKPTIRYNVFQGQTSLDWTTLTNSIAYNEERQDYIVSLVSQHPDHRIMVLSDRQQECDLIYEKLRKKGETSILKLTGAKTIIKKTCNQEGCSTKPSFNFEGEEEAAFCAKHKEKGMINISKTKKGTDTSKYRVLVAGMKKAGVGFDDPTLTMLILATDRKDVVQFEGRIRTTNNIIYDLVDDYKTLENHWKTREAWYDKRGATVEVISLRDNQPGTKAKVPQRRMLGSNKSKTDITD